MDRKCYLGAREVLLVRFAPHVIEIASFLSSWLSKFGELLTLTFIKIKSLTFINAMNITNVNVNYDVL
ncbi:hypothetical protein JNE12007_24290 [Escherichia coli]